MGNDISIDVRDAIAPRTEPNPHRLLCEWNAHWFDPTRPSIWISLYIVENNSGLVIRN